MKLICTCCGEPLPEQVEQTDIPLCFRCEADLGDIGDAYDEASAEFTYDDDIFKPDEDDDESDN